MSSPRTLSSQGSARTPVRNPGTSEEQEEEAATPVSATGSTPFADESAQSPLASNVSGFGTEATDPDDESRPVTKQEFTRFRRRAEHTFQHMYADVMGLLKREVQEQNKYHHHP